MLVVGMVPFSKAAEEVLFSGCDVTDYYAKLPRGCNSDK
jgi:hypothetical protein